MFELLETRATRWSENSNTQLDIFKTASCPLEQPLSVAQFKLTAKQFAGREEYLVASRSLEPHFSREQIRLSLEFPKVLVSNQMLYRLRDFVNDAKKPLLALAGPNVVDPHGFGTMTKIAANFISHATEVNIPVISWFCELPADSSKIVQPTGEERSLIALTYALIRQLIELLPSAPSEPINVDIDDIVMLEGTLKTMDVALVLLKDLVEQVDSMLFTVLDGLQWLDDQHTSPYLGDLILTLLSASAINQQRSEQMFPLVRVLLTTTGRSYTLLDILEREVYLLADERNKTRKGGSGISLFV
jgi:hypothetical protein